MVQDRTSIGYDSLERFIQEHSSLSFEEIFKNWGQSLLGAKGANLGFKHPELQDIRPSSAKFTSLYPVASNINSAPLSHSFLYAELTKKLELISNQSIEASALAEYPLEATGSVQINTNTFESKEVHHGSLWVLLSNTEVQNSEPDTISKIQSVLFIGDKSGKVESLIYDDGIPDTFLGNASYLQLSDHSTEIAVLFSPDMEFRAVIARNGMYVLTVLTNELHRSMLRSFLGFIGEFSNK